MIFFVCLSFAFFVEKNRELEKMGEAKKKALMEKGSLEKRLNTYENQVDEIFFISVSANTFLWCQDLLCYQFCFQFKTHKFESSKLKKIQGSIKEQLKNAEEEKSVRLLLFNCL